VGYVVRTLVSDIVDAYEVNRKECAQVLVNINRWLTTGIFIQPGQNPSQEEKIADGGNWQLESTLVEVSHMVTFKLIT
jgi:nuclear cap-binding protein subunit 1